MGRIRVEGEGAEGLRARGRGVKGEGARVILAVLPTIDL